MLKLNGGLLKSVSVVGVVGMALTACGGSGGPAGPGGNGDGAGGDASSGSGSYSIARDWDACETFDDLQPFQDYLEVTGGGDELINAPIGSGMDAEAMTCAATFDLQTVVIEGTGEAIGYENTGDSTVQMGFIPWDSEEEAVQNFQDRVELFESNPSGMDYTNIQEGESNGEWDESMYFAADGNTRYYITSYARHGDWNVYISMDISYDPGRSAYNAAPSLYEGTEDDMAVYPHTIDEVADWVVTEYFPQIESGITEKLGGA